MSTHFRRKVLLPLALLAVLAPAARAGTVDVVVAQWQFTGQHLTIQLGDTVRWVTLQSGHTTTEGTDLVLNGNEIWHQPLANGQTFSLTFDAAFLAANPRPGNEYHYFCVPHGAAMTGSIKVITGPGLPFCFCSPFGPCSNRDYGAGCTNSNWARGARMIGSGTTSVQADDLRLDIDLLPANKPCVVLRGKSEIPQTQLGEGWRCIGGPLYKLSPQSTGPAGAVSRGPGIAYATRGTTAPIKPGQTWRFQLWYRDSVSQCGSTANVSNGYVVTFTP